MAGNTLIAFFWRAKVNADISDMAWEYWKCTIPVSVVVGPLGAFCGSYVHRQTLAWAVYILELIALIGGFLVVKPGVLLTLTCVLIVVGGFFFFYALSKAGLYLLSTYPDFNMPVLARDVPIEHVLEDDYSYNKNVITIAYNTM